MINNIYDYSWSWYFEKAFNRGAIILDEANLDIRQFPLYKSIKNELERISSNSENEEFGYSDLGGNKTLKSLISKHESFIEEVGINEDNIIINGCGVTGVLNNITQFLVKKSEQIKKNQVIIPLPAYPGLKKTIDYYGLESVYVNTSEDNKFQPTYNQINNKASDKTIAIFLTTPGNPSCNYIKEEDLVGIVDLAKKLDCYLILDSIFEEAPPYPRYQRVFNLCNNYNKLIKIKGFSKDTPQLNDIRIGWSICKDEEFNSEMMVLSELSNFTTSRILENLAITEMHHRVCSKGVRLWESVNKNSLNTYMLEVSEYHSKIKRGIEQGAQLLKEHAAVKVVLEPEAGNLIFVRLSDNVKNKFDIKNSHELYEFFLNKCNTLVSPGHVFGQPSEELWFRITMSKSPEDFVSDIRNLLIALE